MQGIQESKPHDLWPLWVTKAAEGEHLRPYGSGWASKTLSLEPLVDKLRANLVPVSRSPCFLSPDQVSPIAWSCSQRGELSFPTQVLITPSPWVVSLPVWVFPALIPFTSFCWNSFAQIQFFLTELQHLRICRSSLLYVTCRWFLWSHKKPVSLLLIFYVTSFSLQCLIICFPKG